MPLAPGRPGGRKIIIALACGIHAGDIGDGCTSSGGRQLTRFSANLGLLWRELALPDAIHAAARAGFDAVEAHWPYATPTKKVKAALAETGLPMIGINTSPGRRDAGEFGLTALPGRKAEARAAIDQALTYAEAVGAGAVHVMAGCAAGPEAEDTFLENLAYAVPRALSAGVILLIEPLNPRDVPGYFLDHAARAGHVIQSVGAPEVKLMFDCYHLALMEGDLLPVLERHWPQIGHIQFAGVPDRGHPDQGEVDYPAFFRALARRGYEAPLGAEYNPDGGDTEASLGWLKAFRQESPG